MNTTGKFVATVSVSGRAMDSAGNIINRDPNGLPTMWLNILAGSIPNRQTITGTVVSRMGVAMDEDGVIPHGEDRGRPNGQRVIYGQWLHQFDHEIYGPTFSWSMIKDLSGASAKEIEETCQMLGSPQVFVVERPELPDDYVRRTTQHIGRYRMDENAHGAAGQTQVKSNPAELAKQQLGHKPADMIQNPEVTIKGGATEHRRSVGGATDENNPNLIKQNSQGVVTADSGLKPGDRNPDNEDEIIS